MTEAAAVAESTVVTEPVVPAEPSGTPDPVQAAIAESKKYRERAQKAEAEITARDEKAKADEETRLTEQGEFQKLNQNLTTERDEYKVKADEGDALKASLKEELLEKLPEDKRETYKDFSLPHLRTVVKDLNIEPKVEVSTQTPGSPNMTDTDKAIEGLTQQFQGGKITLPAYQSQLEKLRTQ